MSSDAHWAVLTFDSAASATRALSSLRSMGALQVFQETTRTVVKDAFVPVDPYYFPNNPSSPWPGQWTLNNTFTAGRDINVIPAWNNDFTGLGITVGIVDDGVLVTHPDLTAGISLTNGKNFQNGSSNPSPSYNDDNHGTAVAGIVAARGNTVGVVGVAPKSTIAGLRLDFYSGTFDTMDADATRYRSIVGDNAIRVKNHSYGPAAIFASAAGTTQAIRDSAAAGTIHVRSAGNARGSIAEDVNKYAERNIPETLVVGAIGSDGTFLPSSSYGASLTCVAPSCEFLAVTPGLLVLTTDRTGEGLGFNGAADSFPNADYTSRMGYTSAAAPLVTGAMVLLVERRPAADVRYAKHLIARSSKQVDPTDSTSASDGGWKTNAAGFKFNQNYGWGMIDVGSLLNQAALYTSATTLTTQTTGTVNVAAAVPDNNATGISRTFTLASGAPMEELLVTLNVTHTWRGDLEAFVTSPSGTTSRLFLQAGSDNGVNMNWTFSSNAFWGENPAGTWTIRLTDRGAADVGTWNSYVATARMGTLVPAATTINGTIDLQGWPGARLNGEPVTLELRDGSNAVVATINTTLNASGQYSISTPLTGTYDLTAKGRTWLRARRTALVVNGTTLNAQNFSLINGDSNGDNFVDLFDYLIMSDSYETGLGDSQFDARADLNGDDAVDLFDYLILSGAYELEGDV